MQYKLKCSLTVIFSILISFLGRNQNSTIVNTRWVNLEDEYCKQEYYFKSDGKLAYYDCTIDDFFPGTYKTQKDTILVDLYVVDQTPKEYGGTGAMEKKYHEKFLIKQDKLVQFFHESLNSSFKKEDLEVTFLKISP